MIFNCCLAIGFYCGYIEALTQQFIEYYTLEKNLLLKRINLNYFTENAVSGLILYDNFLNPWKEN